MSALTYLSLIGCAVSVGCTWWLWVGIVVAYVEDRAGQ